MIRIQSYAKAKGEVKQYLSGGFANTTININNGGGSADSVRGVNIWGQYHDHTSDINGDLTSNGTVTANQFNGNSATITNISGTTANISGKATLGEIESTYADITTVDADTVNATLGKFTNAQVTNTLTALNGIIDYLNSKEITTEYLTVTKAAHFFKLIIDEIKASQGQIIITPANATIDKVVTLQNGDFKCYFRATDGDKKIYQSFEPNDQVVCQTFNAAEGTSYNVSNKFYWRLCTSASTSIEQTEIDGTLTDCHWIVLSNTDKDTYSISVPEKGDEIVMLGNRTDATRQAAITIGAYNNPYLDSGITAPFIIQYDGINDYNLSAHRVNIISNGLNQFKGTFKTQTGDDIEQLIEDIGEGVITYMHQAFANSADGRLNFSKTYFNGALYVGFCSNHTESDSTLIYSDYTWCRLKGEKGEQGEQGEQGEKGDKGDKGDSGGATYKIIPVYENCAIDVNGTVGVGLQYNIIEIDGTEYNTLTASTSGFYVRFKPFYLSSSGNYQNLSTGTTTPSYSNTQYQTNWQTSSNPLQYLSVELVNGNTVYDKRIVFAQLQPAATFEITDQIKSTVQGCRTDIDSNTNSISTIQQQYDSINQTVRSHTTQLGTIQNEVDDNTDAIADITTDVANLEIRADGISSQVSKYTGVQLINAYGWTKADSTAAEFDGDGYSIVETEYNDNYYYNVYSNVIKLEQGKKYVFSLYTDENPNVTITYSSTNKMPVDFSTIIPSVKTILTDDTYNGVPREAYKFTASNSGYYCVMVGYQDEEVENAFYRPQLELGETPTTYDTTAQMLNSQIVQTANNILLQVSNVGINIDEQKISLNGNTEIVGNLTLSNADQGFILQGIGGTTLITAQSIGTYNQFRQRTNVDVSCVGNCYSSLNPVTLNDTMYYDAYFFFQKELGNVKANSELVLKNQRISVMYHTTTLSVTVKSVEYRVVQDNTLLDIFTNTNLNQTNVGSLTTTADGNINIYMAVNVRLNALPQNYDKTGVNGKLSYIANLPINDVFCMIGYDGIGINFGSNKTVYIGNEGTIINYGDGGLKVDSNKVSKINPNGGGNWVNLNTKKITIMPDSNYTITDDDEMIVVRSLTSHRYCWLPDNAYVGRTLHFKNMSDRSVYIAGANIIKFDSRSTTSTQQTLDEYPQTYVFDGNYWIQIWGGN